MNLARIETATRYQSIKDEDAEMFGLSTPKQFRIETQVAHLTKLGKQVSWWTSTDATIAVTVSRNRNGLSRLLKRKVKSSWYAGRCFMERRW
jgi:hypothetical protein